MSPQYEDPELERRLDRAFQSSRPRRGFEDELWEKVQARRSWGERLWAGLARLPLAPALATVTVVVVLAGFLFLLGHRGGAGVSSTSGAAQAPARQTGQVPGAAQADGAGARSATGPAAFGRIPAVPTRVTTDYSGPLDLRLDTALVAPAELPVYRYQEPTLSSAASFAYGQGATTAVAKAGVSDLLADFAGPGEDLMVLSSDASKLVGPSYQITMLTTAPPAPDGGLPESQAALDAQSYLGQRKLAPTAGTPSVQSAGVAGVLVFYPSRFDVLGLGQIDQVDARGRPVGTEVSLGGDGRVYAAAGPLPLVTDTAGFGTRSSARVAQDLRTAPRSGGTPSQVQLTTARLVYVAVPAQSVGYFEPAWLLTGSFQSGGRTYQVTMLVSALDPNQVR